MWRYDRRTERAVYLSSLQCTLSLIDGYLTLLIVHEDMFCVCVWSSALRCEAVNIIIEHQQMTVHVVLSYNTARWDVLLMVVKCDATVSITRHSMHATTALRHPACLFQHEMTESLLNCILIAMFVSCSTVQYSTADGRDTKQCTRWLAINSFIDWHKPTIQCYEYITRCLSHWHSAACNEFHTLMMMIDTYTAESQVNSEQLLNTM